MDTATATPTFEDIYRTQYDRVRRLCLRMLRNEAEADDLTQDTFIQIYRKLHLFRGESAVSTWVHSVTVNTVLMHIRKHKKRREREVEADATDIGNSDEPWITQLAGPQHSPDLPIELEGAVAQLPDGYRSVLLLHDYHGMEHVEVARRLGVSVGTSKSQLFKARVKIKSLLNRKANPRIWTKTMSEEKIEVNGAEYTFPERQPTSDELIAGLVLREKPSPALFRAVLERDKTAAAVAARFSVSEATL